MNLLNLKPVQVRFLQDFELALEAERPEENAFGARVIGYGEMSTIFTFDNIQFDHIALKRMALFENFQEAEAYRKIFLEYATELQRLKISLPRYGLQVIEGKDGEPVLYILQQKLEAQNIAHKALHLLSEADNIRLFEFILAKIHLLYQENKHAAMQVGFDAQLSNWVIANLKTGKLPTKPRLLYIDNSTPLLRRNGEEQLNPELFLRICPKALVWIIKLFFLNDVINRYYNLRFVVVDIIANLYKEQRSDLIPSYIAVANDFFDLHWPDLEMITEKEIKAYYREDALIWRLFLSLRKIERFWRNKVLRRPYKLILPGKTKR